MRSQKNGAGGLGCDGNTILQEIGRLKSQNEVVLQELTRLRSPVVAGRKDKLD